MCVFFTQGELVRFMPSTVDAWGDCLFPAMNTGERVGNQALWSGPEPSVSAISTFGDPGATKKGAARPHFH